MNKVDCTTFVKGKQYYIHAHYIKEDIKSIGYFSHKQDMGYLGQIMLFYTFRNVRDLTKELHSYYYRSFRDTDTYYDPEKIRENAQQARQQMEQRSLNMILKRLVNDEFQWL